jgi:eukaryotic-like serine/threonine-protein kinase
MGVVYLVFQKSLSRYVALKQIAGNWQQNPKAQDRFLREAKAAAGLSHPGIVPILEIGTHSGAVWYTMEYLEEGDLSQMLARRGGALPWREAVSIVINIAEAIQYAHQAGVAHRDLKPSNILLSTGGVPKVCDFGLAWVAGHEGRDLTATGEILGTPAYLAPEAVSGASRTGDARIADIYSLGALLFHLVAGHPPFRGSHPMEILGSIANDPAPRLSDSPSCRSVPPALDQICARCLEKRPEDRFRSAGELANALTNCLARKAPIFPAFRIRRRTRRVLCMIAIIGVIGGALYLNRSKLAPSSFGGAGNIGKDPVIAVMPIQTLSKDEASAVLAAGLQDELVSTLTRISDLRVVATRSVLAADTGAGDYGAARKVLGAGVVLNASVQEWQDTFRVLVQLINTRDGTTLWSDRYDRRETNILNLQTDIATQVAVHLKARLRPEQAKLALGTSSNVPAAEKLYLQARALSNDASASVAQLKQSETLLTRAVDADPQFALAYALLSAVDAQMYNWGSDRSEQRLGLSLDAAQKAVQLNSDLSEAEIALGNYFFRGSRDYLTARPHFERAVALSPNNPDALAALAYIERRQGDFKNASIHIKTALNLDPLNAVLAYNTADTFLRLREYGTASAILERSLQQMPNQVALRKLRGDLHVSWKGDLGPMGEEIMHRDPKLPTPDLYLMDKIEWLVLSHRLDEALKTLRESNFQVLEGQSIYLTRDGYEALLLDYSGKRRDAQVAANRALRTLAEELQKRPNDARILLHAGQMYAVAGDIAAAEKLIGRTLTAGDLSCVDAFDRGFFVRALAIVLAGAGQEAKAAAAIEEILSGYNQYSAKSLALHPMLQDVMKEIP